MNPHRPIQRRRRRAACVDDHGLYTGSSPSPLLRRTPAVGGLSVVRPGEAAIQGQGSHIRSTAATPLDPRHPSRRIRCAGTHQSARGVSPTRAARCSRARPYRSGISWSSSFRLTQRTSATSRGEVTVGSVSLVGGAGEVDDGAAGGGVGAAADLAPRAHLLAGFLGGFADRGLGRGLVRFDLPAGECPGRDAVTAAHDEHPARAGDERYRYRDGEASLERPWSSTRSAANPPVTNGTPR